MIGVIKAKAKTFLKVFKVYGFAGILRLLLKLDKGPAHVPFFLETNSIKETYDYVELTIPGHDRIPFTSLREEHDLFRNQIQLNTASREYFTEVYDLGDNLLFFLYVLMVRVGVENILESGVAAGKSTSFILKAQKFLSKGKLVSIDITHNVGDLIPENLRDYFHLEVLPQLNRKNRFRKIVVANENLEVFVHDSDHSIQYQLFEIETVLELARKLRWILIDDINQETFQMLKSHAGVQNVFVLNEGHKFSAIVHLYPRP